MLWAVVCEAANLLARSIIRCSNSVVSSPNYSSARWPSVMSGPAYRNRLAAVPERAGWAVSAARSACRKGRPLELRCLFILQPHTGQESLCNGRGEDRLPLGHGMNGTQQLLGIHFFQ